MTAKSVPQLVVEAASALYGDQWRSPMAQSLDLHPRTVRRIEKAARTGEPQPVSPGVLEELATLVRELTATLERETVDGRGCARDLEMIALELDEAARTWTPTRRPKKVSQ